MSKSISLSGYQFVIGSKIEIYRNINGKNEWRIETLINIHQNNIHIQTEYFDLLTNLKHKSKWINTITKKTYISFVNNHLIDFVAFPSIKLNKDDVFSDVCYSNTKHAILFNDQINKIKGFDIANSTCINYQTNNNHNDEEVAQFRDTYTIETSFLPKQFRDTHSTFIPSPINQRHAITILKENGKSIASHKLYIQSEKKYIDVSTFNIASIKHKSIHTFKLKYLHRLKKLILFASMSDHSNCLFYCNINMRQQSVYQWNKILVNDGMCKHYFEMTDSADFFSGFENSVFVMDMDCILTIDLLTNEQYTMKQRKLPYAFEYCFDTFNGYIHIYKAGKYGFEYHYKCALSDIMPHGMKRKYHRLLSGGYVQLYFCHKFPAELLTLIGLFI